MKNASLQEFTVLLRLRLSDILARESGNDRYIFLYLVDGYWTAFEKSAFRLSRVHAPVMLLPMRLSFAPFPIVTASVRQDGLRQAVKGLACRKRMAKERVYVVEKENSAADYRKWHDRETWALRNLPMYVLSEHTDDLMAD